MLDALSERIEQFAVGAGGSTVVCGAFRDAREVPAATWRRYDRLTSSAHLVLLLATDMPTPPRTAATLVELAPADELKHEWVVLALGPTAAALLAARRVPNPRRQRGREFSFVLSYDRELVSQVARALLDRVH